MQQGQTKSIIIGATVVMLLGFGACVGTEIGNPQDGVESEVTVKLQGMERGESQSLTLSNGIEIREAWLVVEEVRFRQGVFCDEKIQTDFQEINVVDLISGAEYPGYEETRLDSGSYCRVEIMIGDVELEELPAGAPEELADLSILVRGTSPEGRDFEIRYDSSETIEFHGIFTLEPNLQALMGVFFLDQWLTPEQLEDVNAEEEELFVISDDEAPEILEEFVEAFLLSGIMARDENNDGVLQDSELEAALARSDGERIGGDGDSELDEDVDDADDEDDEDDQED